MFLFDCSPQTSLSNSRKAVHPAVSSYSWPAESVCFDHPAQQFCDRQLSLARVKRIILIGAVFLLILADFNVVFGAAQKSKTASNKNSGDLNSLQKTESANYEDELPGVLYDLKQTSNGESTGLMEMQEGKQFNRMRTILSVWNLPDTAGKESLMVPYLKRFVVSNWPHRTDSTGQLFFNEFNQFSRSPVNSYKSYFYQPIISSANAPKSYSGDGRVSDGGWVAINSGYVVAPFTGKFRFVGCGDDALVVRFNNQIVLDYGWYALSLGKRLDDTWDWRSILGGTAAKTDPQNRMVLNNPVYSQCKLETYFPSVFDKHGLAKGVPISVTKGKHYPIQVLVTDIESGSFGTALLIERLDSTGVPLKKDPAKLPLFRTSSALPGHSSGSGFPDFDEDSPIWRVVDSNGKSIPSHKQGSKLVVTTAKDVVDAKDGLTSIREAISYAKTLGGVQTISFNMSDGDNVTISNPALIYHDLRFAANNEANGNPVTVTLDKLNISKRSSFSEVSDRAIAGGGVLHTHDANIMVSGGKYMNNRADSTNGYGWGGVIRMVGGTLTVDGAVFDSNYAYGSGGAVNSDHLTKVTIRNTHFENNSVSGNGGGLILWYIPESYLIDTDFIGNSALSNKQDSDWSGGAIRIYETNLVYEVTAGKTITNINNDSRIGGFIALTGPANVEFKVNGTLNIGNGNGKDSFETQSSSQNVSIRKTGSGTMTINAPVSDYKGTWTVEDGILNMNYGGSIAGPITVNGGRLTFDKDYTFTKLVIRLAPKKKDAYVGGANHLSGGKYCISIDTAIPEGSYLLAEGVKGIRDPVIVQTKDGTSLGTLSVGRETIICDGRCTLTLDGGKLSLSVLAPINSQKKTNTDAANAQPQRDPNLKKTVTKTTRGNVTTETVTEYNGDTTIETVTTTEVNGDTTTTTTTTTETKNGKVVKRTSTTTTTTTEKSSDDQANFDATGIIHLPGGVELKMVKVEAGTFTMGAADGENGGDERAHEVTLKHDYYIGKTEVTQAQWNALMNSNPSHILGDDLPVDQVSWDDAHTFCRKMNEMNAQEVPAGYRFDLPTEAQWEYAARGGKKSRGYKYSGSNDYDPVAWTVGNSHDFIHPVGTKQANELGLHDMSGNVWEWCRDFYEQGYATDPEFLKDNRGSKCVCRGGGWRSAAANYCRVAKRSSGLSGSRDNQVGFRLALVPIEDIAFVSTPNKTENTGNKTSSSSGTTPKKNNPTYNPFGYTSPLMEDD